MGRKFIVDYPDEAKTSEQKGGYLRTKIIKLHLELEALEYKSVEKAYELGKHLILYKKNLKKKKLSFTDAIDKMPGIHIRTAQRCMKLVRHVDLDKNQSIKLLGKTRLRTIISKLGKKGSVEAFLDENKIDYDEFDEADKKAVTQFKTQVDDMLQKRSDEKRKVESEEESESDAPNSDDDRDGDGNENDGDDEDDQNEVDDENGDSKADEDDVSDDEKEDTKSSKAKSGAKGDAKTQHSFGESFQRSCERLFKIIENALANKKLNKEPERKQVRKTLATLRAKIEKLEKRLQLQD